MNKEKILQELESKFDEMKKELGLKVSLNDLDSIFYIRDSVLKEGFVSENLGRQISYRIAEVYMGWNEYMHSLIMPNPQNMFNMGESKTFSQEEKKEIIENMKKIMEISSRNSVIVLTKNKKMQAKFIEDALNYWNNEFKEKAVKIMKKINQEWGKQS